MSVYLGPSSLPTPPLTPSVHPLYSRGFKDAASSMGAELEKELLEASEGGKLPIVVDTSPCLGQIKSQVREHEGRGGGLKVERHSLPFVWFAALINFNYY